jgi:cellulose synthase/poly-beta-1,6-N-acetylglucosamine synthase-like glycosyltransferase
MNACEFMFYLAALLMLLAGSGYAVMIAVVYRGLRKLKQTAVVPEIPEADVFISVIIAARNEEEHITFCLQSLAEQSYPRSLFEVVVVDDHSEDGTAQAIRDFARRQPDLSLRYIRQSAERAGKKQALETAIRTAGGELIITTDADCLHSKDLLHVHASYFRKHKLKMILGPLTFFEGRTAFSQMQTLEFLSLIAAGAGMAGTGNPVLSNGANMGFSREAFLQAGGYGASGRFASGDDIFLLQAIKKKFGTGNIRFLYHREALVFTHPPASPGAFFSQRIRWASKARAYHDKPLQMTALIVFLLNLLLVAGITASFFNIMFLWLTAGLFLLKCVCDFPLLRQITGFTGQRKTLKYFPLLQLVYPLYIVAAACAGIPGRFTWKGRRCSGGRLSEISGKI